MSTLRWECRHSSAQMLYLEVRPTEVVTYFDSPAYIDERLPFDDVLAGKHDAMINLFFGTTAPAEIKAAIRAAQNPTPPLTKDQLRELRRRET